MVAVSDVKTISDDEIHTMLIIIAMGEGELIPVSRVERLVKEFRNLRIENADLSAKIGQFEQYAELGKLILNGNPCYFGYEYADGDCVSVVCSDNEKKVCKLRAELLAEVQS